jgi:hypothetical protein
MRRRFRDGQYRGLELEINQKHVRHGGPHWRGVQAAIVASLRSALEL